MRFSLKAIFALLTICSLLALVYQEQQKVNRHKKRQMDLRTQIDGYDPHLRADLPYLKRSTERDLQLEQLYAQVKSNHEIANLAFVKSPRQKLATVSVFHVPALRHHWKTFFIDVPETTKASLQVFASVDPFGGKVESALKDSPFNLSHPVQFVLPNGLSSLSIKPADGGDGVNCDWKFELNGQTICTVDSTESGFSGENLIWLLSKQKFLTLHENVYSRVRYDCEPHEHYLEFAGFYSTDFYRELNRGNKSATLTYLKCALSFENRTGNQ